MNDDFDRELQDLGPLMAEQARLETEGPDPAFATELRARLMAQAARRQAPAVASAPRRRRFQLPRWSWGLGGLGAAVAVAAVVVLLLLGRGNNPASPGSGKTALFVPPTPSGADVTKSYPFLGQVGGGGGPLPPTQSRIEYLPGSRYPGKLTLSAGSLPSTPSTLRAYRLQDAAAVGARMKALAAGLGIHAPVQRVQAYDFTGPLRSGEEPPKSTWLVARQGSGTDEHSVAISTLTGTVIYHNLAVDRPAAGNRPAPPRAAALSEARRWLTRLGWPGSTMPEGTTSTPTFPGTTVVPLNWSGVAAADRPGAEVWVQRGGVDEALILPPVGEATTVKPMSVADAWKLVQSGKAPVGVVSSGVVDPRHGPDGTGRLQSVSTEQVVTFTKGGRIYLVPAYRFTGTVKLHGIPGTKTWFALVPAT